MYYYWIIHSSINISNPTNFLYLSCNVICSISTFSSFNTVRSFLIPFSLPINSNVDFIFQILVLFKNAANHFNDNFSGSLLRILSLQCTRWNTSSFYIHQWSAAIKKSKILITFFFPMIYSKQNNTFIFGTNYALVTFPAFLCQKITVSKCHA